MTSADAGSKTVRMKPRSWGHLGSSLASIVSVSTDFRLVLAVGGVATAALVAVVLLRSTGSGPQPSEPRGQLAQESAAAFAERTLSKRIVPAFVPVSAGSQALNEHVLSALEALPKTLILEQTRGAVDTAVYRKAAPATVLVATDTSFGSGVVIDPSGEILTNYHVIRDAKRVAVVFKPERGVDIKKDLAYGAIPIEVDKIADLAMLKVQAPARLLHPLSVADISKLEVGNDVRAIGHPEGEAWTYTTGTISQIRPHYEWKEGDEKHRATVIQTQTAINPGNSGGPLLNNRAQVIGINSFRMEGEEGLNYAIACDTIEAFLKRSTSRIANAPTKASAEISRIERFGDHIAGAYMKSHNPPPDVWLILGKGDQPLYAVTGSSSRKQLNTVFKGTDPNWKGMVYYFDVNCDGVIDLIGYSSPGSNTIDRYQRPQSPIRLDDLASDLADAFSKGVIPYHEVQICH